MVTPFEEPSGGGAAPPPRPRVWPVFVAYLMAAFGIFAVSVVVVALVHEAYPDTPEGALSLPLLLGGGLATATVLATTLLATVRPLDARRLRLLPGRESGAALAVVIVGTLALGQALGSAVAIAGLDDVSAMAEIRRAVTGATGSDLFAAMLVVGPIAGAAEEIFFRGFMQTALRAAWPPAAAVTATAACFALLHVEPIHAVLALALGLWLGVVTERTGSALPAVAAHVINNAVSVFLMAQGLEVHGLGQNLLVGGVSAGVFAALLVLLLRRLL